MFLSKKMHVSLSGSSFMKSFWWFLALRAFVGIGEASYSTIAPAIISDLYSKDQVWTGDVCSLAQPDQLSNLDSWLSPNAHKRWCADSFFHRGREHWQFSTSPFPSAPAWGTLWARKWQKVPRTGGGGWEWLLLSVLWLCLRYCSSWWSQVRFHEEFHFTT